MSQMYIPSFPYKDNQIILSSDRVTLHSKTDSVFVFGTSAIGLSSKKTINLDAYEKVLISAPKIELGADAEELGQPIVLSVELTVILLQLLQKIEASSVLMAQVSTSAPGASMQYIKSAAKILHDESTRLINILGLDPKTNPIMSKTTFTR